MGIPSSIKVSSSAVSKKSLWIFFCLAKSLKADSTPELKDKISDVFISLIFRKLLKLSLKF
jgi:hypothetical protein